MLTGGYSYGPQPQVQTNWSNRGGVTGNGYISWQDAANALVPLWRQKVDSANEAWRNGTLQNPTYIQQLRNEMQRWENIQATGTSPQMFSLPQYSTDNFFTEANETSRLFGDWNVRPGAVEAVLPWQLRGQNQGQLMRPWTATGMVDSNFGSGSDGNYVTGGYAKNVSNTAPSDPNRPSAFSSPYNGGQPMGTGSYLGGPGGPIPSLPFGSQGPVSSYNSFGPGAGFTGNGTTGTKGTDTTLRYRDSGNYSPDPRGRVNPEFDWSPYYNWKMAPQTAGGTVLPMQYAQGSVQTQPTYTQKLQGDINNFASGATGAMQRFNGDLQASFQSIPASYRAEQMSRDMGVFGDMGNRYQPRMQEVYGPWNMGGMYASGNSALNQGMLGAYYSPHFSYAPAPRMSVFGSRY